MKQSLQLKLGTQLTMTPQLQQAIRLLQLSTLDLQQEVQAALDSNPMLEPESEEQAPPPSHAEKNVQQEPPSSAAEDTNHSATEEKELTDTDWNHDIPAELPVDSHWDDIYSSYSASQDTEDPNFERNSTTDTLQDHLRWQLNLTTLSTHDKWIGEHLIDSIGLNGLLDTTTSEIAASLNLEEDEVVAALKAVQQFEPAGCAARDLQECLQLQLRQLPTNTPWLKEAQNIIERHLELLGKRDFRQLSRRTRLNEAQLGEVIGLIQTLTPNPGEEFNGEQPAYVVPDIIVNRKEFRWQVELNPEITPKIRINSHYASLVKRADNSRENNFLRDHLQEARWFLKSLQSRHETLLKVATCIVDKQQRFFEEGPEAMRPMVLADIAETIGMHESTISRVTTQKYMLTPRGVFELKYFFSSHVSTNSGEDASSTAIRALIRKLIDVEVPRKPLSDNKIAQELDTQGIKVARRTVAKYRESMGIPSSSERKRLI
ncbi:RNA polymerase factor sigma-54 [Microbulbifer sp. OS29]|uniref:RNA polymerase sigma-54 factor n=1 Tax=Microbulbifer okhotskensis TaxID=2926617 RepID=A0A9X2EMC3_9GAMM|nr:RNA polymerase factor sigma-54 [Microbulbifer okhotskensis]MCO1333725.1 RNA polymerase factor sigma-54 [Microbulbifer okhotskensis]